MRRILIPAVLSLVGLTPLASSAGGSSRSVMASAPAHILYADTVFSWESAKDVVPRLNGQATRGVNGGWTYVYTLKNDPSSANAIMRLALDPVLDPGSIGAPTHWMRSHGFAGRPNAAVWMVVDTGPPPTGWDSVSAFPSPFDLQPGDSLSGFTIVSPHGPGMITYYVQGFYGFPLENEPDAPTLFDNSVSGTVIGPAGVVGIDDTPFRSGVEFAAPAPNPARAAVSLSFYLPAQSRVLVAIYDVAGRRIRVLIDEKRPSGVHSISWNGVGGNGLRVSPGVYFYRLVLDGKLVGSRRVVIIR